VLVTDKVVLWGSTERTVRMAYKKHIGKLPRRRKIESLAEGVLLHITAKDVTRSEFKSYKPKYVTYAYASSQFPNTSYYGETAAASSCSIPPARTLAQGEHWWDDDDDEKDALEWSAEDILDRSRETDCDEGGGRVPLMDVIRAPEPDSDFEWKLCDDCAELWERLADEQWEKVN